ncbi:MAG: polyphosphate polymerase domain-containing protein [Ilumatobacteraceae bacterium]
MSTGHPADTIDAADLVHDAVAGAARISLAEVEQHAALQTRVDRKYALDVHAAAAVIPRLVDRSAVMGIGDRRSFWYRSVYFDTADHESYRRAATKRRVRWKVRSRSYVETGTSFLEVKRRGARGVTEKVRVALLPGARTDELDEIGRSFVDGALERPGLGAGLAPVCTTVYQRTTLVDLDSTTRATIDTSLMLDAVEAPGLVIVETKSPGGLSWFDRTLMAAGARPEPVSKFGLAIAAIYPDLPANRWSRLLRTHMGARELLSSTER